MSFKQDSAQKIEDRQLMNQTTLFRNHLKPQLTPHSYRDNALKDQWIGNNVDLNLLSQSVNQFFTENQFEPKLEQTHDRYRIKASNFEFKITVNIYGRPNDFTIEFIPNKKTRGFSLAMMVGYITSFLGGGALLVRDARYQEVMNKVEQTFWEHVDRQVAELKNSAKVTSME